MFVTCENHKGVIVNYDNLRVVGTKHTFSTCPLCEALGEIREKDCLLEAQCRTIEFLESNQRKKE